ncbi:D-alanyl-D-alanine carboxypeptidase family protein [Lachnotalea sp. AF33-28]|uniref:D-alanyl-D-alanine carboxypeptidase family protein n=1 Tax=Lachnotalea sp. AF33-28 TaxID=2292046 RepID=UPI00269F727E|nr:hypothetical protein [Lachnotalea sp. AF33-28]
MVKRQTNKRNRWKQIAVLCVLIVIAAFGAVILLGGHKKSSLKSRESFENTGDFSQASDTSEEQSEAVPVILDRANAITVDITAENAIVMNTGTNAALYQKNSTDKIAPASTAKMITALTVLDYCPPEEEVTVGAEIEMIHEDSSIAWLVQGDTLTVRQLLIALLLPSGNDAAYTLAVNAGKKIAGDNSLTNERSVEVFMDKVNEKARALGAESSNFVVPDGYDTAHQYTTAYDLAIIAKACLDNPFISEIVACSTSYEKWVNGREVTYNNTNELLNPNSQYYRPEVIGLKTGTSSLGGACVVSAAVINGETYVCVVMGSSKDTRFRDSSIILDKIKAQ